MIEEFYQEDSIGYNASTFKFLGVFTQSRDTIIYKGVNFSQTIKEDLGVISNCTKRVGRLRKFQAIDISASPKPTIKPKLRESAILGVMEDTSLKH